MPGVHIIACAPEETQSRTVSFGEKQLYSVPRNYIYFNSRSLCTVTGLAELYNLRCSTMGISEEVMCDRFLDAVKEQVSTDPANLFESFVGILRQEPALTCYIDSSMNSRGEKCMWMHTIC